MSSESPLAGGHFRPAVAAILVRPELRALLGVMSEAATLTARRMGVPMREVVTVFLGHLAFVAAGVEGFPLGEFLREVAEVAEHLAAGSAAYEAEQGQRKDRPS